ncbi:DUF1800 domain-containing protein [Stieleria sp. TO1_6]|uniref:DUF1800 domain-containing protein n=1 Tax=Stieleria tagensis TaxID=2956795 RepID=UPI00209ADC3A|nr:DUF1800 family protein [Stieleria tagensis]MCO8122642.1 DUF1800 domain-containing protein [Stieleria tagensis]
MRMHRDQLRSGPTLRFAMLAVGLAAFGFVGPVFTTVSAGEFPADNPRHLRLVKAKVQAAQFLSKATFGCTEESIDELAERINQVGYKRATTEWIDQQFDLPMSSHEDTALDIIRVDGNEPDMQSGAPSQYRYQAWWHIALTGEDQLRQRVAWALSQIFVIGDSGEAFNNDDKRSKGNGEETIVDWVGMSRYYDMLAQGASGNYRDLLEDVTYNPCMGVWLSSLRNRKANVAAGRFPDENYAREIMQLFSVGLYEMHPDGRLKTNDDGELIPTYDNTQIKELGRLFTGFKYSHNTSTSFYAGRNYGDPMAIHIQEHDNNFDYSEEAGAPNSKTVFGTVLPPLPSPLTEQAVRDEIGAGLDAIANHPNVAPFICRLLIQRLVKSNPSRAYMSRVTRVFNDNGQGQRGDLRAVVTAILTDPELYRSQRLVRRTGPLRLEVVTRGTEYSRLREPINRVTSLIRAVRPTSDYAGGYMMLSSSITDDLGQMPFRSPSVFNYYLPDYQPPGDLIGYQPSRRNPYDSLFAPEFQILNAVTANRMLNRLRTYCRNRYTQHGMRKGSCRITFHLEPEIELAQDLDNMDEILQRFDLWLCNGTLSEETKTSIKNAVIAETEGRDYAYVDRLEIMLNAVLVSPDCAIEQ